MENEKQEIKRNCISCGKEYSVTISEQNFYESKGLALPKRCAECRKARKAAAQSQEQNEVKNEEPREKKKTLDDLLKGAGII